MKTTCNYLIITGILFLFHCEFIHAQTYDPDAAAEYADLWAYKAGDPAFHNPSYKLYYTNNDCSNFVSQCLIAGGLNLDAGPGINSEGCIPACHNLHTNLINYQNATYVRKTSGYPSWFIKGDVIILGESDDSWAHTMFAATSDTPPLLDGHTNNRYHYSFTSYPPSGYVSCDFYHINSTPAPANDECSGAKLLNLGTTYSNETLAGATSSFSTNTCGTTGSTQIKDVWYKFVATSSSHTITADPSSGLDIVIDLRQGSCNGTNIGCKDDAGGKDNPEVLTYNSFSVGSTYYIRIYQDGTKTTDVFSINISSGGGCTQPTNDNCSGNFTAFPLTFGSSCNPITKSSCGATSSGFSSCSGTQDDDVFFSFVPTSSSATITVVSSPGYDAVFQVLSGPCGGTMMTLDCTNNTGTGGTETTTVSGLSTGTMYFVRVWHYGSGYGTTGNFTICAYNNCTAPTSPSSATASQTIVISGQSTNLQVIGGALNSAPNWVWYTGSCGGTQIGTGTPLSVSPTTTTTYYVQASACGTTTTCRSVTITVNSACTPPNAPTSCITSITSPVNGLEHFINSSIEAVIDVDGYSWDYSWDGINWTTNWLQETGTGVDWNLSDQPNTPLYLRVRAYKCSPLQYSNYINALPQPIYSACDEPAAPTVNGATSNSLNVTLNSESPVVNPSITTYSIYCTTTSQYVQVNGTLGGTEVFQTKSNWATKTITCLSGNTQYCFYVKARNGNGDVRFNPSNITCGSTGSQTCTPVTIATHPQNQTVDSGSTATFSVSVNGTGPFSYFWYKNGDFQTNTTNTASTSNSYTTPTLTILDNGNYYYCLITNCTNSYQAHSNDANLTVNAGGCTLSVSPSNQNVPSAPAGSTNFLLTANCSWTAVSNQTWCTVTPSGSGNGTITANYSINSSTSPRSANITVTVAGLNPIVVTVMQNANVPIQILPINLKVFLEGAYNTVSGLMNTNLNPILPLTQNFNISPWNYAGSETAISVPAGIVDWVLVELRQAADPASATTATILAKRAAFLKSNGTIVDLDGTSLLSISTPAITNNLYVVIRHRNHLAVMSATGATLSSGVYSYDFTTGLTQAYGGANGFKMVGSKAMMVVGDIDHDGSIHVSDYNSWATGFGVTNGYFISDLDMDRNVFVSDYNKWAVNFGSTSGGSLKSILAKKKYFSCVPK